MVRVVATCTTIPTRYNTLIKTIESLVNQKYKFNAIYLALPKYSERLKLDYPPLPDYIKKYCTIVRSEIDYGPVTKLYGALISEKEPDTIIFSVDDDVIYPPQILKVFLKHALDFPNHAITSTGSNIILGYKFQAIKWHHTNINNNILSNLVELPIPNNGRDVDLLFGISGVIYRRKFFPCNNRLHKELFSYALNNKDIFLNDDILVSAYLDYMNIKRRVFNDFPLIKLLGDAPNALSASFLNQIRTFDNALKAVKKLGLFPHLQKPNYGEIVIIRAGIFALIILTFLILLIIAIYYAWKDINPQEYLIYKFI